MLLENLDFNLNMAGHMEQVAISRLERESQCTGSAEGFTYGPIGENMFCWKATIEGPAGTSYEGGLFQLVLTIPEGYPFKPPKVAFTTKLYHPNIDSINGEVKLNMLNDDWSPVFTIDKVLSSIFMLMKEPNLDAPLMPAIAALYQADRSKYDLLARNWTQKYAMSGDTDRSDPESSDESMPMEDADDEMSE